MTILAGLATTGLVSADTVVTLEAASPVVALGETVDVYLRADISDPVWGWGLDVGFSDGDVASVANVQINEELWQIAASADGDGLVGLAFPDSVAGEQLLLATITVSGDAPGLTELSAGFTADDLTEGFPLDPIGFDGNVVFEPISIRVLPEAGTWVLLALGGMAVMYRRASVASPRSKPASTR